MTPERWQRLKDLYPAARERTGAERAAYLQEVCGADAELRRELESLLRESDGLGDFLQQPVAGSSMINTQMLASLPAGASDEVVPQRVGRYRVLGVLGRGGMGVVYLAEQENPRRTVALKVLRPGLASASAIRRFELEAQVLARLQHTAIAQIYEAGVAAVEYEASPTGAASEYVDASAARVSRGGALRTTLRQPFFAMERIDGVSLTDYAARHNLRTQQRLMLFATVCSAVQHAHQKGVIHRDLKPSNILVDSTGQPKVLDFGVARMSDSDTQATTLHTDMGQLIGTVPYMSPEQVLGDPAAVDARSDVYALGVVLYELLAGRLPYDLSRRTIPEAVRIICEQEPTRLSTIDAALRGDLATIVGKALEKEKERRYQSASELGGDIERYLHDEPILARSPSAFYQLRKFARRNKVLVGGVAFGFLFLVLGIAGTTWQAYRATRGWEHAELVTGQLAKALAEERAAKEEAREQNENYRMANAALNQMLEAMRPDIARGGGGHGGPMVLLPGGKGDEAWRGGLIGDMELRARQALEERRCELGDEHPSTYDAMATLAGILSESGALDEAGELLSQSLAHRRRWLGDWHQGTISLMVELAGVLRRQKQPAAAERLLCEALGWQRDILGDYHPSTLSTTNTLAGMYFDRGAFADAAVMYLAALGGFERILPDGHRAITQARMRAGVSLFRMGQAADARPHIILAFAETRSSMGYDHAMTRELARIAAQIFEALGDADEAAEYRSSAGPDRPGADQPSSPPAVGLPQPD